MAPGKDNSAQDDPGLGGSSAVALGEAATQPAEPQTSADVTRRGKGQGRIVVLSVLLRPVRCLFIRCWEAPGSRRVLVGSLVPRGGTALHIAEFVCGQILQTLLLPKDSL